MVGIFPVAKIVQKIWVALRAMCPTLSISVVKLSLGMISWCQKWTQIPLSPWLKPSNRPLVYVFRLHSSVFKNI